VSKQTFNHLCEKFHQADTKTILITLIQPKVTYYLSTFRLRRKPSSGLTSSAGRQYVKACPLRGSTGSSPRLDSCCQSSWSISPPLWVCQHCLILDQSPWCSPTLGKCQGDWSRIRQSWQAIWIRKTDNMNRDEGSYQLSHVWDKLLHTDDRHRKSVLTKASDMRPKCR